MNLLQTLLSWRRTVRLVAVVAVEDLAGAAQEPRRAAVAAPAPPRPGCGWFDSSHELRAGLQVCEHAANDAVCAELPLAMWLELQQA